MRHRNYMSSESRWNRNSNAVHKRPLRGSFCCRAFFQVRVAEPCKLSPVRDNMFCSSVATKTEPRFWIDQRDDPISVLWTRRRKRKKSEPPVNVWTSNACCSSCKFGYFGCGNSNGDRILDLLWMKYPP